MVKKSSPFRVEQQLPSSSRSVALGAGGAGDTGWLHYGKLSVGMLLALASFCRSTQPPRNQVTGYGFLFENLACFSVVSG